MPNSRCIALLLFLSPGLLDAQTCIIALRLSDGIIIGADSRRTTLSTIKDNFGVPHTSFKYDTICKAIHANGVYFSNVGMASQQAYETAKIALNKYKSLNLIAKYFTKVREPQLYKYIDSVKGNTVLYEANYNTLIHFESIIYGIENNVPRIVLVKLTLTSKINEPTKFDDSTIYYQPDSSGKGTVITMGEHDAVTALLKTDMLAKMGLIEGIKYMLEKQSELTPNLVAAPFEVFTITAKGIEWNYNPLNCK